MCADVVVLCACVFCGESVFEGRLREIERERERKKERERDLSNYSGKNN